MTKTIEIVSDADVLKTRMIEGRHYEVNENGCWVWKGAKYDFGYGMAWDGEKNCRAHRLSWTLHRGRIPDGMLVCHSCDVPACVNPAHLFIGTTSDNIKDKMGKNRQRSGEKSPVAKHSDDLVRRVVEECGWRMCASVARKYGIPQTTVRAWAKGIKRNYGKPKRTNTIGGPKP